MFITDWSAFLTKQPQSNANVFINDYISKSTSGRGSATGYIPAGSEGVGGNNSYASSVAQSALQKTSNAPKQANPIYSGNPSQVFSGSNGTSAFKQMNTYLSNPSWQTDLDIQQKYQAKLAEEKKIAETKANAGSGFIGKEVNGVTVTPGSIVKDQTSKVQNMGLDVLANANNLPEVISAAVSQIISQTMSQGIGNVMATVTKETSTSSKQKAQQNSAVQNNGPGVLYNQISGAASSAIK
jgi:cytochrome c551/c552